VPNIGVAMVDVESEESMSADDPRLSTDPIGPPDGDSRGIQGGLRGQVLNGLVWGAGARVAGLVIQMIGTVVLARLIAPSEFGLFAIAAVFYGFGGLAGNLGLGTAIIQRPRITEAHLSTAFWFNAVIGVGLTLLQIALAPTLAGWLHQPDVTPLIQLVALAYTLSLSTVPMAILERSMKFRTVAIVEMFSSWTALGCAVIGAFMGFGAYALIGQILIFNVLLSASALIAARWWPRARPTMATLKDLWSVSIWFTFGNLVGYWGQSADTLALGRTQATAEVGYYNRGYNLMQLPMRHLGGVLTRVTTPALSYMQSDIERSKAAWLRSATLMALVSFPVCLGMAAAAPALVRTLWGSTWIPVVPLLQVLSLAGIAWSLVVAAEGLMMARGRAKTFFWLSLLSSAITIVAVLIGVRYGALGVAAAILIRSCLILPIYIGVCLRDIDVSFLDVLTAVWKPLVSAVAMGLVVWGVGHGVTSLPSPLLLVIQVIVGVCAMWVMLRIVAPELLDEAHGLIRRRSSGAHERN
jgi:PST family polysaccharide transporter